MKVSSMVYIILGFIIVILIALNTLDKSHVAENYFKVVAQYSVPQSDSQSLTYQQHLLYQSTATNTTSQILIFSLKTGKTLHQINMPPGIYAQGITIMGKTLYVATYDDHGLYLFNKDNLKFIKHLEYQHRTWGLSNDGHSLIYSDGSSQLTFIDPTTLKTEKIIKVHDGRSLIPHIYNLSYLHGIIFASIYSANKMIKLSTRTGKVVAWYNLNKLNTYANNRNAVLQGIAINPENQNLFVTGRFWPKIYILSTKIAT